jgi:hypothetical protein
LLRMAQQDEGTHALAVSNGVLRPVQIAVHLVRT